MFTKIGTNIMHAGCGDARGRQLFHLATGSSCA